MENKLTIVELAPYLPYGLQMMFDNKISGTLSGITPNLLMELIVLEGMDNNTPIYKNWCMLDTNPILRPLSGIFNLISIGNGVGYLAELMWGIDEDDRGRFLTFGDIPDYWDANYSLIKEDCRNCDYGDIQVLLKNHFDVFGLIEKGLAIDINTLDK